VSGMTRLSSNRSATLRRTLRISSSGKSTDSVSLPEVALDLVAMTPPCVSESLTVATGSAGAGAGATGSVTGAGAGAATAGCVSAGAGAGVVVVVVVVVVAAGAGATGVSSFATGAGGVDAGAA